jgi:dTDP-4-amino-4,6-dideoxygalactose transaminase
MSIPHSMPTLGTEEAKGLQEVLASGRIATGEEVEAFEQATASYLGLAGAAATASGTAALHLSLLAVGVKEGTEVICPSFTCSALINAVYYCRAVPTIVDVDEEQMNISLAATRKALTKRTAAIIIPHMFGSPVEDIKDFPALGPPIIEDCAQSLGATYRGRMTGTWGAAAIFSFYATKVITTGQGGMVTSNDNKLLERVRDLREYDKKENFKVRYNYCMTDLQAKMGRLQLEKLPSFLKAREERARWYDQHIQGLKGVTVPQKRGIFYRYIVRIKGGKLDQVLGVLHREGIEAQRPVFLPLHRYLGLDGFSATERVFAEALSLPIYPRIHADEVRQTALSLRKAVEDMHA